MSPLWTPAHGHHRITLRSGAGGYSTYLVMQIHHEWVLVGRVSGWVKHSWRRAGKSEGAGLIYRDVRLLGEGRVHLGLILAQQGCHRSVASSPLTPGRGAAGPPQERNRAGVTPQPRAGWLQEDQCEPSAQGEMLRALCQATSGWTAPEPASRLTLRAPSPCPQSKRTPAPQGPLTWMCFPGSVPQAPLGAGALPQQDQRPGPPCPCATGDRAPGHLQPYLRRRWSGLLQGPPEKRRWANGAEGGRLFTASSHGRIGDVGRRMGTRDLRLQAGQDSSTLNSARGTAGHGTVPSQLSPQPHPHTDGDADSWSLCCSST